MSTESSRIDVNVTLGRWPTRRVPLDVVETLVAKLREYNVAEAWVGHFDGLFHEDLTAVNDRLVAECRGQSAARLRPFGSINPLKTDWRDELDRCVTKHRMPGIRLHPNYHGYTLDHPQFALLLKAAAERGVVVQLAATMEDERMMHPLMRVPNVDLKPLAAIVEQIPKLRLVLLNATKSASDPIVSELARFENVYFDIAMLETVGGVEKLLRVVRPDRILLGSHAPCLYFESAVLKLRESNLPAPHMRDIETENARRIFKT